MFCLAPLNTEPVEALECGHVFHTACVVRCMEATRTGRRDICVWPICSELRMAELQQTSVELNALADAVVAVDDELAAADEAFS